MHHHQHDALARACLTAVAVADFPELAATCRAFRSAVQDAWCVLGVSMNIRTACRELHGRRWDALRKLRVYRSRWHNNELALDYAHIDPVPRRLPRLRELVLCNTRPPLHPEQYARELFTELAPCLQTCVCTFACDAADYIPMLSTMHAMATHGAPRLCRLEFHITGIRIDPGGEPTALHAAIQRIRQAPPIISDTLREYHSTGGQLAGLAVRSPVLHHLELEDATTDWVGKVDAPAVHTLVLRTRIRVWPHSLRPLRNLRTLTLQLFFLSDVFTRRDAAFFADLPRSLRSLHIQWGFFVWAPHGEGPPPTLLERCTALDELCIHFTTPPPAWAWTAAATAFGAPAVSRVTMRGCPPPPADWTGRPGVAYC